MFLDKNNWVRTRKRIHDGVTPMDQLRSVERTKADWNSHSIEIGQKVYTKGYLLLAKLVDPSVIIQKQLRETLVPKDPIPTEKNYCYRVIIFEGYIWRLRNNTNDVVHRANYTINVVCNLLVRDESLINWSFSSPIRWCSDDLVRGSWTA